MDERLHIKATKGGGWHILTEYSATPHKGDYLQLFLKTSIRGGDDDIDPHIGLWNAKRTHWSTILRLTLPSDEIYRNFHLPIDLVDFLIEREKLFWARDFSNGQWDNKEEWQKRAVLESQIERLFLIEGERLVNFGIQASFSMEHCWWTWQTRD